MEDPFDVDGNKDDLCFFDADDGYKDNTFFFDVQKMAVKHTRKEILERSKPLQLMLERLNYQDLPYATGVPTSSPVRNAMCFDWGTSQYQICLLLFQPTYPPLDC